MLEESISAVSSSLLGNLEISLVAATVARVTAWGLGLPFPIVLAVLTGFLDLIPRGHDRRLDPRRRRRDPRGAFAAVIKIVLREAGAQMASLREDDAVTPAG